VQIEYAAHDERERIAALIRSVPVGARIVIVGHSWGADTAAQIVERLGREGRPVDLLITVDPVGRGVSDDYLRRIRAGAREWINVNATGGDASDVSNSIARLGSPYGRRPERFASRHIDAPFSHGDFAAMLRTPMPGMPASLYRRVIGQ
jgi:pimeloyl-ACP methyl ester carboxylesterase